MVVIENCVVFGWFRLLVKNKFKMRVVIGERLLIKEYYVFLGLVGIDREG